MVEEYKSDEPIEERKSQKLNFWDFAKGKLVWQWLPVITGAATMGIGRLRGGKGIFPIDGSPMILYKLKELVLLKGFGKITNQEVKAEGERLRVVTEWFHDTQSGREALEKDLWNIGRGLEVVLPIVLFREWRNKEAKKLDLTEASNRLKSLDNVKPTDAELAAENKVLAQELAFEERTHAPAAHAPSPHHEATTTLSAKDAAHEGMMQASTPPLQPRI